MTPLDWGILLPFVGGIIATIVTTAVAQPLNRAKASREDKEGEASLSEVTMKWAKHLQEEIENLKDEYGRMSSRIADLEAENDMYRRHNAMLTGQVMEAGLTPVAPPKWYRPGDD